MMSQTLLKTNTLIFKNMQRISKDLINLCEMPLTCFGHAYQETIDMFSDGIVPMIVTDPVTKKAINGYVKIYKIENKKELPGVFTKSEEDVLVALMELSYESRFSDRKIEFKSLRQLLKLLGWPLYDEYYVKLIECLKNLKLTIIETDIFWDNEKKSYGSAIFNIIDELVLYERNAHNSEKKQGGYFTWNSIIFGSISQGMIKSINIDTYQKIKNSAARKLYRVLDKRFYKHKTVWFPLEYLSVNILRLKNNGAWYYKRNLNKYIKYLIDVGYISGASYFTKHKIEYVCFSSIRSSQGDNLYSSDDLNGLFEGMLSIGVSESMSRMFIKTKNHSDLAEWLNVIKRKDVTFDINNEAAFFVEAIRTNYQLPKKLHDNNDQVPLFKKTPVKQALEKLKHSSPFNYELLVKNLLEKKISPAELTEDNYIDYGMTVVAIVEHAMTL